MFGEVKLVWVAGVDQIAYLARVSNVSAKPDDPAEKLIAFLIRNRHWSPFEMASMCIEINTTRDIGRQILRHRSFSFQEFSQRYAEVPSLELAREARLKGSTNRQGSIDRGSRIGVGIMRIAGWCAIAAYRSLLWLKVAPECARAVLPEGLTPTRMYMTGTIRSWVHYLQERTQLNVQKEHRLVAEAIKTIFAAQCPLVYAAVFEEDADER